MRARPSPRRFTASEFARLVDVGILRDDENVELIDGEIVPSSPDLRAMSPQGALHAALTERIASELFPVFPRSSFCVMRRSPLEVGADSVPEPDVFVAPGACEEHERAWPRSAVVVVEVSLTTQATDRGRKALLYARGAVGEYWVVDAESRTITVHRRATPTGWEEVATLREGAEVSPGGREAIPVERLLPRA